MNSQLFWFCSNKQSLFRVPLIEIWFGDNLPSSEFALIFCFNLIHNNRKFHILWLSLFMGFHLNDWAWNSDIHQSGRKESCWILTMFFSLFVLNFIIKSSYHSFNFKLFRRLISHSCQNLLTSYCIAFRPNFSHVMCHTLKN